MRRNRLKNINTVFLLGAGASYAISLPIKGKASEFTTPLDITFNRRLLNMSPRARKAWIGSSIDKIKSNWIGAQKFEELGLEEAIIKRLGNYELLKAIHPIKLTGNSKTKSKCDNFQYLNHLSHLIVELLSRCKQNTRNYAERFAKHALGSNDKREENRIITFNYDVLIDDVLLDKLKIPKNRLYFDRLKDGQDASDNRKTKDKFAHPYLLKLHGSINWRISSQDFENIVNGNIASDDKIPIWIERDKIPDPEDDVSPLILPPLPNKPITETSIFRYLWQWAFEYLHEAKKLVIVGYSCPVTDSFATSMLSQMYNMNLEEVVIVDKDSSALDKYRALMSGRIPKRTVWTFYGDFVDYIENH